MSDDNVTWPELKEFCKEKQGGCLILRQEQERAAGPANRWNTAVMLGSAVMVCVGLFLYLSANSIRDYDIQARERFVSIPNHDRDIKRIEDQIQQIKTLVAQGQDVLADKLDRVLAGNRK